MAKGRSRYFCQMRCDVHMESEMNAYGYIRDDVEDISKAFAGGHWTGERDSYPDEINEAVWGRVNAIGSQCPKKRCPHYHRCPFFLARALLESVDVVIANHDIVLSDLSLGGGIILPRRKSPFMCSTKVTTFRRKQLTTLRPPPLSMPAGIS